MELKSLEGCRLAIGSYPYFHYDARGGGGKGTRVKSDKHNLEQLDFSPETFSIPPLTSKTTKFLNLPLPPGLKVDMRMDRLCGTFNRTSGEILLNFESRFIFTLGSIFTFPDLYVKTLLTTGKVKSDLFQKEGLVLQEGGRARLVGIAIIPLTGNKLLDIFLSLPNEALAVLECNLKYV